MVAQKVFISSVRQGLEDERDALPPLIRAIGHVPRRFEDFTAQPVASREACLQGVEEADIYLLLLGQQYGEPIFDSGLSPTEEEWVVARRRGIPILVFRKRDVDMEEAQLGSLSGSRSTRPGDSGTRSQPLWTFSRRLPRSFEN